VGIKVERAHRFAFAFGIMIKPYIGVQFLIIMYAAVVLGGLGSILGAFWGGVIIGFVQQVSTLFLPLELQSAAIFVVFVTTLFFLPQGLFGRSAERI
jgi:branched-chain amino acid transport system permease protein